ncbi:MAG: translation initiation factor IF-2 [Kiritimatiellae bacterium]|nr:translation initiation factor IF-2 [Kiritimatiellia bacterium]
MRVYELAKKMQTSCTEIIKRAEALDIEVYSTLAVLDDKDVKKIEATLAKRTVDQIRKGITDRDALFASKREKARQYSVESTAALRDGLEANRAKALEAAAEYEKRRAAEEAAKNPQPVEPAKPAVPTEAAKPEAEKPAEPAPVPVPEKGTKKPEAAAAPAPAPAPAKPSKPAKPAKPRAEEDELDPEEALAQPFLDRINRRDAARERDAKPARSQTKTGSDARSDRDRDRDRTRERDRSREQRAQQPAGGFPQRGGGYQLAQPRNNAQPQGGFQNRNGVQQGGYQNRNGFQQGNARTGANDRFGNRDARNARDNRDGRDARDNRRVPLPSRQQGVAAVPRAGQGTGATAPAAAPNASRTLLLNGAILVKDLAEKLGVRPNRLIADLMKLHVLVSINQHVEMNIAQTIAESYGFKVEIERQKRQTERRPVLKGEDADDDIPEDKPEDLSPRPPVVTFLGHVDHGKTSLMDRIRKSSVAAGEAGGITQAISAYSVETESGRKITFIDTPGHAAFSAMRSRGASMTDIAVIIIAADDGIMPQTKEAIAAARKANVTIMVAINKCDLPTAKPDRVRQMLQGEKLTPEDWGGDVICCNVSARTGEGIDQLLEMILLQADMMELTANPNRRADGCIVEAKMEPGQGPTAIVLVEGGTLKVGDVVLCGQYFGKVRALIDDCGRRVKSAGPSMAVKVTGLSGVPVAGDHFRVMLDEKRARVLAEKAAEKLKQEKLSTAKASGSTSFEEWLSSDATKAGKRELPVIVKADTQGSEEAIVEALHEIVSSKVSLNIIGTGIGNVCETDVVNAGAGHAIVVGFNIGCESGVQQKARHDGVRINTFRIIYELIDYVKNCMLDLLPPEYKEVVKGHAVIKAVFDIGKLGRVAGCQMLDGMLKTKAYFRVLRNKTKLWEGKLSSLKHFQQEVAEITGAQECGIHFNGFEEFQEDDVVECFEQEELPRSL